MRFFGISTLHNELRGDTPVDRPVVLPGHIVLAGAAHEVKRPQAALALAQPHGRPSFWVKNGRGRALLYSVKEICDILLNNPQKGGYFIESYSI